MAQTRFSGPVRSDNGFVGDILSGTISSASGNVTNLTCATLTIGSTMITTANAASGAVSSQLGFVPVMVGSTTAYIALYQSITV